MKWIYGSAAVLVAATSALGQGLDGPYMLENWATPGIFEGETAIGRWPAEHIQLSYEVDLGNPGPGVPYREAAYTVTAQKTGTLVLDWSWTGFHSFFQSFGGLMIVSDVGDEPVVVDVVPYQDIDPSFDLSGTVSVPVEAGNSLTVIVAGENFDSNSALNGVVTLSPAPGFVGAFEPQNWVDSGIPEGLTMLDPDNGATETLAYSYEVDLGNPGPGVPPRSASITLQAPHTSNVSFDWHWEGFHAFFQSFGGLSVAIETSEGVEVIDLVAYQDTPPSFEFEGSTSFAVEEGFPFSIIVSGENFDTNSTLEGILTLSDFAVTPQISFEPLSWSDGGILEGESDVGHDLSTPADGALFQYLVDLGNPGPGVPYRDTTFSATASATGDVSFDWRWTGFHAFFASNGVLQAFVNDDVIDLVAYGDIPPSFDFSGDVSLSVEAGDEFGLLVGGDNFDSNSILVGSVVVTEFVATCLADYNDDGVLNILDFVAFQNGFLNGDEAADCNGDGVHNILDFVCFQNAFALGCG